MNGHRLSLFPAILAVVALVAVSAYAASRPEQQEPKAHDLVKEVRHQLVLLPYYSVFDNLSYRVDGTSIILVGQVVRPTLKSDAENVVKRIEGVSSVQNDIEILPVSPDDDQIRRSVYRAIYGDPQFTSYGFQAVPSIHIIVKNGNVTLEGIVDNENDKTVAGIRVKSVPNVFSVKNNLLVTSESN